jgi:hypothetical protein
MGSNEFSNQELLFDKETTVVEFEEEVRSLGLFLLLDGCRGR